MIPAAKCSHRWILLFKNIGQYIFGGRFPKAARDCDKFGSNQQAPPDVGGDNNAAFPDWIKRSMKPSSEPPIQ